LALGVGKKPATRHFGRQAGAMAEGGMYLPFRMKGKPWIRKS
jgi:hypothetical protein